MNSDPAKIEPEPEEVRPQASDGAEVSDPEGSGTRVHTGSTGASSRHEMEVPLEARESSSPLLNDQGQAEVESQGGSLSGVAEQSLSGDQRIGAFDQTQVTAWAGPLQDALADLLERVSGEIEAQVAGRNKYIHIARQASDAARETREEFEKYRKRTATDVEDARIHGRLDIVNGVIEALDNLERALEASGLQPKSVLEGGLPEDAPDGLTGALVGYRDLSGVLLRAGVKPFDPLDQPFDPEFHEASERREVEDVPPNTVVEVIRPGYCLGDRVIRPARVIHT